jgi:hypothetical protein
VLLFGLHQNVDNSLNDGEDIYFHIALKSQQNFQRWSKFQKMAPKTSDIRKVDVAKTMLCQLLSDVVTFYPGMLPLRRKCFINGRPAHSRIRSQNCGNIPRTKVTWGVPTMTKSIVLPAIIGFLTG